MKKKTCETCRFWNYNHDYTERSGQFAFGSCQIKPPTVVTSMLGPAAPEAKDKVTTFVTCGFPITQFDAWCGEHKEQT